MKSLSAAKSIQRCFICGVWSWDVTRCGPKGRDWVDSVSLCLPCYVDVLEVRQARGVMGEPGATDSLPEEVPSSRGRPATTPGNSPSPYRQGDLFD